MKPIEINNNMIDIFNASDILSIELVPGIKTANLVE